MIRISDLILLVIKGNPKARFVMTLEVFFWDLKGIVSSSFKVSTENYFHIIKTGKFKVAATRLTMADDLKPEWDLKVTNEEFVFSKSKIEESVESELHVIVLVNST